MLEVECCLYIFAQLSNFSAFYFADNIQATFDATLVGEDFLCDIVDTLSEMKGSAIRKRSKPPYLCQYYNISPFYSSLGTRGISRILHPFAEALNKSHQLPKLMLIIPDKDLISSMINYNFGVARVMGAVLHYIIKQMDTMVDRKRKAILEKKPRAITPGYPKIFWIRMLKSPKHILQAAHFNQSFALWGKFNSILEE